MHIITVINRKKNALKVDPTNNMYLLVNYLD